MKITKVWFDDENIYLILDSGHTIGDNLSRYPKLKKAAKQQRENYELGPTAESIHWEELDEDISLEGFFDFGRALNYSKI